MIMRDVLLPDTKAEAWPELRERVSRRILSSLGDSFSVPPVQPVMGVAVEEYGVIRIPLRFSAFPGWDVFGSWVLPEDASTYTGNGVLCLHGTDQENAHRGNMRPDVKEHRAYAVELAKRGWVTLSVDQFGFGEAAGKRPLEEMFSWFYEAYPESSIDGVRLAIHRAALGLLADHPAVDADRLGCIGHSLGGRAALYLAALDERVSACVSSTGLSPNQSNVYRNPVTDQALSPQLNRHMMETGQTLFEYQELLALIAPRSLLLIEPWNDPCNPSIEAVFRCFEKARFAFELLEASSSLQMYCHGHGHDTPPALRSAGYRFLENACEHPQTEHSPN